MAQSDIMTITAVDPTGPSVRCLHGDGRSTYSGQYGWQFTKRPRRESMTEFMGYDPYTLIVPVIFGDGADTTANIDPALEVLRNMARTQVGPRVEPAVVEIDCPLVPLTWLKWIIQDISYTAEYRNDDGSRYYAALNITFFEWVPTDLVAVKAASSVAQKVVSSTKAKAGSTQVTTSAGGGGGAGTSTTNWPSGFLYTVKKGDTLETIAKNVMGQASAWKQIAALNGNIRDPNNINVGQVLRLPFSSPSHLDVTPKPVTSSKQGSIKR